MANDEKQADDFVQVVEEWVELRQVTRAAEGRLTRAQNAEDSKAQELMEYVRRCNGERTAVLRDCVVVVRSNGDVLDVSFSSLETAQEKP